MSKALYFGKLPHYSDFIRFNASGNDVLIFDQWIQDGISAAKAKLNLSWDKVFEKSSPYSFHLFSSDQKLLMGIWYPSHDQAGRKFPFIVARNISLENTTAQPPIAYFLSSFRFNEIAIQLVQNVILNQDIKPLEEFCESDELRLDEKEIEQRYITRLEDITLQQLSTDIWGKFNAPQKYILFHNLSETLVPLRKFDFSKITLGLKFPIGINWNSILVYIFFWLKLTAKLLGRGIAFPQFFWSNQQSDNMLWLFFFFRFPSAKNFVSLLKPNLESDNICDLDKEGIEKINHVKQDLNPKYLEMIETPDLKLNQVLYEIID